MFVFPPKFSLVKTRKWYNMNMMRQNHSKNLSTNQKTHAHTDILKSSQCSVCL